MTRHCQRGHTLIEMMVVLVILSILAVAGVPTYSRAVEQANVDACAAGLRSVWSAQRAHWLEHRAYTDSFAALVAERTLDAGAISCVSGFQFRMTAATATSFAAEAARTGDVWSGVLAVDQTGAVTGDVVAEGGARVAPCLR
ncbi:MAG: prepilin-type N-terminal cleavage/methylation domain-containing protein [Planctomycetes bacterium]|nr:prepilin-type N-terminal cleavage/methylation domain-containing protein [Planctomycetota bacterium]